MKKVFFLLVILIMSSLLFLFVGCSNNNNKIVIYTCMEEKPNQELKEKLKEQFPNLDINVQYMATGNSAAKIKTEGSNIEADIILDLETVHAKNLEKNFSDLSEFDSSMYLDDIIQSKYYFPWTKYTMSLIIDKNYFQEHNLTIPKNYQDLLNPEYKDLIAMPDPKTSGTGYAFLVNVVNIMGEENAFNYFKNLKNNLREFTTSGSGPTNLLKQGEIAIAMGMTSEGAMAINDGYNFKIISLETGVPYNTTSFGIIKGKENNEHIKEVFTWILNDFNIYHKENFMPDKILKNQKNNVKNYPVDFQDADMTGINDTDLKNRLIEKWGEVNG